MQHQRYRLGLDRLVVRVVALAVAAAGIGPACGGSTAPVPSPCGQGTLLAGHDCVPESGAPGNMDAAWSDAADASVDQWTASEATADVPSGDGPPSGEDGSDAALEGAPPEAAPESGVLADDPCPSAKVDFNCSTTCGGVQVDCPHLSCPNQAYTRLTDPLTLPLVFRTPSHPGTATCPLCFRNVVAASISIEVAFMPALPNGLEITVAPPWKISAGNPCPGLSSDAAALQPATGCLDFKGPLFVVWTDDPSAPSRNVVIVERTQGVKCP